MKLSAVQVTQLEQFLEKIKADTSPEPQPGWGLLAIYLHYLEGLYA